VASALVGHRNPFTEQTAGRYFVGREEQLRNFERTLEGLRSGQPSHKFVAGIHGTGKTSYLAKLVELARDAGLLAALLTFDLDASGKQHIAGLLEAVINALEEEMQVPGNPRNTELSEDWNAGVESKRFRVARKDRLSSDDLQADLKTLQALASDMGREKIVLCVDEGQRINGFALSALKNALQHVDDYLVVISLRIVSDGDPVNAGREILVTKAAEADGDYGASRIFMDGIPIGPFASDVEARACVTKRLDGNAVSFDEDVLTLAGRVAMRHPANLIALSSAIYDIAVEKSSLRADSQVFKNAFIHHYSAQYEEASSLCGSLTETGKKTLRALLDFANPVTPEELTAHMYPGTAPEVITSATHGVAAELHQLDLSPAISVAEDRYVVDDPVRRYALTTVLGAP
jgi:hypothetical protein